MAKSRHVWIFIGLATLVFLLVGVSTGIAVADGSDLVFLDGQEIVEAVRNGDTYTLVYRPNMSLTLAMETADGTPISVDTNAPMTSAGTYGRWVTCNGITSYIQIVIQKMTVPLAWQTETMEGIFGQTHTPIAVATDGGEYQIDYYARSDYSVGIEALATYDAGTYSVFAKINETNYDGKLTGSYQIKPYPVALSVVEVQTLSFDQVVDKSMAELFSLSVEPPFSAICKLTDANSTMSYIETVGEYSVQFFYEGKSSNFLYPSTPVYTLSVTKAQPALAGEALQLAYRPQLATLFPQNLLDAYGSAYWLENSAGEIIQRRPEGFSFAFFENDEGAPGAALASFPTDIGSYWVEIAYLGDTNYEGCAALQIPLVITKQDVSDELAMWPAENTRYDGNAKDIIYEVDNEDYRLWTESGNQADIRVDYYQGESLLPGAPSLPGEYRAVLVLDSACFVGSHEMAFTVTHAVLSEETVRYTKEWVYGQEVLPSPTASVSETVDGNWQILYAVTGSSEWTNQPKHSGWYDLRITLSEDSRYTFDHVYQQGLYVAPKPVALTVHARTVAYGDSINWGTPRYGELGVGDVWWPDGGVMAADRAAFLQSLSLAVLVEGQEILGADARLTAGMRLSVQLVSSASDYVVSLAEESWLTVEARPLSVRVDLPSIYYGATPRPYVSVDSTRVVFNQDAAMLADCFEIVWLSADGEVLPETPTEVGNYAVRTKPKADLSPALAALVANYAPIHTTTQWQIKSKQVATNQSGFEVEGLFEEGQSLTVEKGIATDYQSVVKQYAAGYNAQAVYQIDRTPSSTGTVTVRLDITGIKNAILLVSYDNTTWQRVDCTQSGSWLIFEAPYLASRYLVCSPEETNWALIGGLIAAGVAVLVLVILLVVRATRRGKTQTATVATPNADRHKSEEDELDDIIATFDESTVVRELTPAERLALREKEEKFNQYRQRLARMRGGGDKAMQDKLAEYSLSCADDEAIIMKMIAEDEARAKALEEEILAEEEEAAATPAAVILARPDYELNARQVAPTHRKDDDDEVDI